MTREELIEKVADHVRETALLCKGKHPAMRCNRKCEMCYQNQAFHIVNLVESAKEEA